MLFVIEGLDGAGKSTQVKMLRAYLESICPDLQYIHFPRYDAPVYGDLISPFPAWRFRRKRYRTSTIGGSAFR